MENGYDLSINKYKKTEYKPVEYPPTSEIMDELDKLEWQITEGLRELRGDGVMAKWNYVKIGDVCTVERGGSPRPIDKFITDDPNGINWIKIGDTTDSMYITETAQKIIPEGMKKSRYVQPGDFFALKLYELWSAIHSKN